MKYGHNKRSCFAKQRFEEIRQRLRSFYRDNAYTDWNLEFGYGKLLIIIL